MRKILLILIPAVLMFAFCACGGSDEEEPAAYTPIDVQVEAIDGEDANVYTLVYDIDGANTDEWSGYWDARERDTAVNGIKQCLDRDDWTPTSVIYGEDEAGTALYSYGWNGIDGDYESVKFFQAGVFHKSYELDGLL